MASLESTLEKAVKDMRHEITVTQERLDQKADARRVSEELLKKVLSLN